jgi:hypothetical protein
VVTPFPPYRDATVVLRYNTEDVVRPVAGPLACTLRNVPATINVMGKLRLSVRHDHGWTFPRDVLEALETVEAVPLSARCGFWAVPGGVAVDVVVREDTPEARHAIARALDEQGVPVQALDLVTEPGQVRCPLPLRCDLHETMFTQERAPAHAGTGLEVYV